MFEPMFDHCCRDLSNLVLLGLRKELKRDLLLVARVQPAQRLVGSCRIHQRIHQWLVVWVSKLRILTIVYHKPPTYCYIICVLYMDSTRVTIVTY